jgi:mannose-1-phosphate guanylyltransferase/mannose-6-phosphate isomerase
MDPSKNDILSQIYQDDRPWGNFRCFALNQPVTVKILTVDPEGSLSLQSHKLRDELWIVLDDGLRVQVDDDISEPQPRDEIVIMRGQKHRLSSTGPRGRVLEVAFGHFDEDDIERFGDLYGR